MESINTVRMEGICTLRPNGDLFINGKKRKLKEVWETPIRLGKGVEWDSFMLCIEKNKEDIDFLTQSLFRKHKPSDVVREWSATKSDKNPYNIDELIITNVVFYRRFKESYSIYEYDTYIVSKPPLESAVLCSVSLISPGLLSGVPVKLEKNVSIDGDKYETHTTVRSIFNSIIHEITYYGLGIERETERVMFEYSIKDIRLKLPTDWGGF
jgi:hypothetical protein